MFRFDFTHTYFYLVNIRQKSSLETTTIMLSWCFIHLPLQLLIKVMKVLLMSSSWQPRPRTARLLGETTAAYPVPRTRLTPANQTAASAAGWPFGPNRPPTHLKVSATWVQKRRCRASRSFPSTREVGAGLPPSPPGSFRRSAARAPLTAASPPAAIPRTLEVSPPTQAAWISPPGRTLGLFSACLPTWLKS